MKISYNEQAIKTPNLTCFSTKSMELLPREVRSKIKHINDIVYIQAQNNYSLIHTHYGKSILVAKTLKSLNAVLCDSQFIRIHQSYCINKNYITEVIKHKHWSLLLHDSIALPVSRSKKYLFNIKYNASCINASFL